MLDLNFLAYYPLGLVGVWNSLANRHHLVAKSEKTISTLTAKFLEQMPALLYNSNVLLYYVWFSDKIDRIMLIFFFRDENVETELLL